MSGSDQEHFKPLLAIGLMSGTSADGVDAALVRTDGQAFFEFTDAITIPYLPELRTRLLDVAQSELTLEQISSVERAITDVHIVACRDIQQLNSIQGQVRIVGFHGHTIRHLATQHFTWQIGDAGRLAESVGCPVVSNFRRRDMAAGGQGAPLAPLFHRQMLGTSREPTMILNLGGVANITWMGDGLIRAGDTGPGCGLLDAWTMKTTGQVFDSGGALAAEGIVDHTVVEAALQHEFFQKSFPKSADRFEFGFINVDHLDPADGAATLCACTVAGVVSATSMMPRPPSKVWVAGGGSKHPLLMSMLRESFGEVEPVENAGLRADSLEAECFAWLAVRRLRQLPTSLPETTGCKHPSCGGDLTA